MKKIAIFLVFLSLLLMGFKNDNSDEEYAKLRLSYHYSTFYCFTSERISEYSDSSVYIPEFNNIIDLRKSKRFKKLKEYFLNSITDSSYYILINRVGSTHTNIQGEENNTNIKEFAQYLFIKDFDSKNSGVITICYYDKKDSISSTIFDSNIIFEKIKKKIGLKFKRNKIKPKFMFDVQLFKVDGKKEKSIIFEPYFWRFPSDCGFVDWDEHYYENDASDFFNWLRLLNNDGILFDKFGHSDEDFL
ncbi:MAG TPA: hypothetical protein PLE30_10925 [Candidatus Kapabacteria bacterium]|nr:hypothetical protein [Candidatus Kapabacteria bacterium]